MNEIKYFLAVARTENMHKASNEIGISPGSLSKAIGKLEHELGIKLFRREGRNIKLTEHGRYLKQKGSELINLETSIKTNILGRETSFNIVIAGSEVLVSHFGIELAKNIRKSYPSVFFRFETVEKNELGAKVRDGEVDLGITSYELPKGFEQKVLSSITFNTYISKKHQLYSGSKNKSFFIDEVLKFPFVTPKNHILGKISKSDSSDGWRDDKFPRKIGFSSTSLKAIESIVSQGDAIAYLPDYYGDQAGLVRHSIDSCPYHCKQKVVVFAKDKKRAGWLNSVF